MIRLVFNFLVWIISAERIWAIPAVLFDKVTNKRNAISHVFLVIDNLTTHNIGLSIQTLHIKQGGPCDMRLLNDRGDEHYQNQYLYNLVNKECIQGDGITLGVQLCSRGGVVEQT